MLKLLDSASDAIGGTPLVRLDRLTRSLGLEGAVLAKLDYLNPGGSKKDRVAKGIIEEAERCGTLKPGQPVVELTSGNTGTGLAIVCNIKGYPFVAVMSKGNSRERARMMSALGARVVFDGTGAELLEQTNGRLDGFVDFVGSGGTYAGVTKKLKEGNPEIQCFIVEPKGAAAIAGEHLSQGEHPIQGGGYSMPDLVYLKDVPVNGYLQVTGDQAKQGARLLARSEGIFGGFSSGANVTAAIELLRGRMRGKTIAIMICDSGLKYLSTDLWEDVRLGQGS